MIQIHDSSIILLLFSLLQQTCGRLSIFFRFPSRP
jgi:hypothetical protein